MPYMYSAECRWVTSQLRELVGGLVMKQVYVELHMAQCS